MKKLLLACSMSLAMCGQALAVPVSVGPTPGTVVASSGNVANAVTSATFTAVAGKTNYLIGLHMASAGATAALAVSCTITGLQGGTETFAFVHPILGGYNKYDVTFNPPVPAANSTSNIVASCPASGTGGTNASMNIEGVQF